MNTTRLPQNNTLLGLAAYIYEYNKYILFLICRVHFFLLRFLLFFFFGGSTKEAGKKRLASPPSTLVQTLTDSVHFFIKCLLSVLNVFICLILFSLLLKSSLCARPRVFRVWVPSVSREVNKIHPHKTSVIFKPVKIQTRGMYFSMKCPS